MSYNKFKELAGTFESVRLALSAAREYRTGALARRQRSGTRLTSH